MRVFAFLVCATLLPCEASADVSPRQKKQANEVFWEFATCIAEREPHFVQRLLTLRRWGAAEARSVRQLARRNADCSAFSELGFNHSLFIGSLAAAAFVKAHSGQRLPDYSATPFPVSENDIRLSESDAAKQELALLRFAGCVFRNRSEQVRDLLEARPFSARENDQWKVLNPVMGACLPASSGTQMNFSRVTLRGLFGRAAYVTDKALAMRAGVSERVH